MSRIHRYEGVPAYRTQTAVQRIQTSSARPVKQIPFSAHAARQRPKALEQRSWTLLSFAKLAVFVSAVAYGIHHLNSRHLQMQKDLLSYQEIKKSISQNSCDEAMDNSKKMSFGQDIVVTKLSNANCFERFELDYVEEYSTSLSDPKAMSMVNKAIAAKLKGEDALNFINLSHFPETEIRDEALFAFAKKTEVPLLRKQALFQISDLRIKRELLMTLAQSNESDLSLQEKIADQFGEDYFEQTTLYQKIAKAYEKSSNPKEAQRIRAKIWPTDKGTLKLSLATTFLATLLAIRLFSKQKETSHRHSIRSR